MSKDFLFRLYKVRFGGSEELFSSHLRLKLRPRILRAVANMVFPASAMFCVTLVDGTTPCERRSFTLVASEIRFSKKDHVFWWSGDLSWSMKSSLALYMLASPRRRMYQLNWKRWKILDNRVYNLKKFRAPRNSHFSKCWFLFKNP